jgi:hypothetical protein
MSPSTSATKSSAATPTATSTYVPPVGFSAGNVVVLRAGDGVTTIEDTKSTVLYLDEYQTTGSGGNALTPPLIQSMQLPGAPVSIGTYTPNYVTSLGRDTDMTLSRSTDGEYLVATGYDIRSGTDVVTSSSDGLIIAGIKRVVGRVYFTGKMNTTLGITTQEGSASWSKLLSACTKDGTRFYSVSNRVDFKLTMTTLGNTYSNSQTKKISSNVNAFACTVYNDNLYIVGLSSTSSFGPGIVRPGTGLNSQDKWGLPIDFATVTFFGGNGLASSATGLVFINSTLLFVSDKVANVVLAYRRTHNSSLSEAENWVAAMPITPLVITMPSNANGPQGLALSRTGKTVWVQTSTAVYAFDLDSWSWQKNGGEPIITAPADTQFRGVALAPEIKPLDCYGDLIAQPDFKTRFANANVSIVGVQTNVSGTLVAVCNYGFYAYPKYMYCESRNPIPLDESYTCTPCSNTVPEVITGTIRTPNDPGPYPANYTYTCAAGYFGSSVTITCPSNSTQGLPWYYRDSTNTEVLFTATTAICPVCNDNPGSGFSYYCTGGTSRLVCPAGTYAAPDTSSRTVINGSLQRTV